MKPVIAIIGGLGEMGRWFSRFFRDQGFTVLIGEPELTPTCAEVAAQADVVVISVPLHLTEAVIADLAPFIRPEALLTDLTSLKQGPMQAMLQHFPGAVVGTHPLFGPGEKSLAGQNIVLCRGRGEEWFTWLHDLLAAGGAKIQLTTPAEHDRLMSLVQGLTHFTLISLGTTFRRLQADIQAMEALATPTFRAVYDQVHHLVNQNFPLYAHIQLLNPQNRLTHAAFSEAVEQLRQIVLAGDAAALMQVLVDNQRYFEQWQNADHVGQDPCPRQNNR
ncbi:MAG: prephenate dehydrogenase/arogenate dehydrogenase family protein [Desulfobacca sp.]|uniref:prephenate dehydrogenase/arogenate dehydrogenase family protein n=1 Tax=Desulfobacca sp. TaxID=2067990 RepID=UPI004049197F